MCRFESNEASTGKGEAVRDVRKAMTNCPWEDLSPKRKRERKTTFSIRSLGKKTRTEGP
jgi:hypothetical protein